MRNLFLLLIFLFASLSVKAQDDRDVFPKQRERIKQLAKLKLIETLELNEDESVRFFAKFNEFHKNIENIQLKRNETIDEMKSLIRDEKSFNETKYNEIIKKLSDLGFEEIKIRNNFINSIQEFLPKYKVAKLIVFEREFNRQLRDLMEPRGGLRRWNR